VDIVASGGGGEGESEEEEGKRGVTERGQGGSSRRFSHQQSQGNSTVGWTKSSSECYTLCSQSEKQRKRCRRAVFLPSS
jgi:hypothetical protein